MSKPYLLSLLALLMLLSSIATGQTNSPIFNTYIYYSASFSPVNLLTEERYHVVNPLPDSLNLTVDTITNLQTIINKQMQNKVYAVNIERTNKQDLKAIFDLLTQFKNLTFLKLSDPFFPNAKDRPYQIPANIKQLQQLKAFEVSFTDKLDVDDALDKLKDLKQLSVLAIAAYNHPVVLGLNKLPGVKHVSLSSTNLLGVDVSKLGWQTLKLSGSLPQAGPDVDVLTKLSGIKTLTNLILDYYSLGNATALPQFNQLSALSFANCAVAPSVSLFSKIAPLKNLTNLSFTTWQDSLQTINGIEQLSNLKYLSLILPSMAKNTEQLRAVGKLKNLQSLHLASSKITLIPDIFSDLPQLKKLRIEGNLLEQLPSGIFNLPQLEYLNAGSNKLQQLPALKNYSCKNLKTLNLSYNALTALPQAITSLTNLELLDARSNKLTAVNGNWGAMTKLKDVNLQSNMLTTFPAQLQLIGTLENLNVSENNIAIIPDVTDVKAYNLKSLNVASNQLTALPYHIGRYAKLEYLQAQGNRLTSIPESLGDCQNIKTIDLHSESRRAMFDANKSGNAQITITAADGSKQNNIQLLPARLKDAANLTQINLSDNSNVNSDALFDILLSRPRKNLRINLRNTNISQLPNNAAWANQSFFEFDLSNNKLQTLPPEFAKANTNYQIILTKNPLKIDPAGFNGIITNKADMKVLYDELHIDLPATTVSDREYAIALAARIPDFYNAGKWEKGIEYAKKAMIADPAAYAENVRLDYIGLCRFKVNDYTGAIKDFERYLIQTERNMIRFINSIDPVISAKAQAHMALGQKMEAAKTYEYYYTTYGRGLAQAAVYYKAAGNESLFSSMLDMALRNTLDKLDANKRARPNQIDDAALDYAELLLIAGKPTDAMEALANYAPTTKPRQTIKSYLLATAGYLKDDTQFEILKASLAQTVSASGKISNWDFDLFNTWLQNSGLSKLKQEQLMALQNMAK